MMRGQDSSAIPPADARPVADTPVTLRVAKSTIIIFAIIFLPLLIWGTSLIWNTAKIGEGTLIVFGYLFMVYWVSSPTIKLLPGRIVYATLFKRTTIDLSRVYSVSAGAGPAPLLAFALTQGERRLVTFRIKPFSKTGLVALLRHVRRSNACIRFDPIIEHMSKAEFHSVTRETIASRNLLFVAMLSAAVVFGGALIKALLHG